MSVDRDKFLDTLADSFEAYYDLYPAAEGLELPLVFRADYHSRAERYWLSKNIPIWGNETNEFAYIFSAPAFDPDLASRCIDFALEHGLPMVKPHKEHQYTNIKVILVADNVEEETARYVKKRSFSKNYKFSFHGFSTLKSAIVDLGTGRTVTNSAGHELAGYFSKLFAAGERSKL